jgi:hypothetical protein
MIAAWEPCSTTCKCTHSIDLARVIIPTRGQADLDASGTVEDGGGGRGGGRGRSEPSTLEEAGPVQVLYCGHDLLIIDKVREGREGGREGEREERRGTGRPGGDPIRFLRSLRVPPPSLPSSPPPSFPPSHASPPTYGCKATSASPSRAWSVVFVPAKPRPPSPSSSSTSSITPPLGSSVWV